MYKVKKEVYIHSARRGYKGPQTDDNPLHYRLLYKSKSSYKGIGFMYSDK